MKLDWDQQVGERWIPFHLWLEDSLLAIRRNHLTGKLLAFREWCRVMKDVLDGLD